MRVFQDWMVKFSLIVMVLLTPTVFAEPRDQYEPSPEHPFGRPNPDAPDELAQFAFMIGENDCTESRRSPDGQTWSESTRSWNARYTLNGHGIFDWGDAKSGPTNNMRVFDPKKEQWHVTYFAASPFSTGVWTGGQEGEDIVLRQPQIAPASQIPGYSTLTFSNVSDRAFNWRGEWISEDQTIVYPFWKISCKKRQR